MVTNTFSSGVNTSFSSELNTNFTEAQTLTEEVFTVTLLNHVRDLVSNSSGIYGADYNDLYGEGYSDANGRNNDVNISITVDSSFSTNARFSTNKYTADSTNVSYVVQTIPSGTMTSTIDKAYCSALIGDFETGASVKYKLLRGSSYTDRIDVIPGTSTAGISVSDDGMSFYYVSDNDNLVYQRSMSVAHKATTATVTAATLSRSADAICISNSGSKLYLGQSNTVAQYTMSTPWDLSTATSDSKTLDTTSETAVVRSMAMNSTGTTLIVMDTSQYAYQYTLSTPWDMSTASYASKSYNYTEASNQDEGGTISADGSQMVVLDYGSNTTYIYNLTTEWDISTAYYTGVSKALGSSCYGYCFDSTGRHFYAIHTNDTDIEHFVCGTVNDATTIGSTIYTSTESTGWLDINTQESFTAFTDEPDLIALKLTPKGSAPTALYPSVHGYAIKEL